jgi:uncharacterized protein YjiS (DUF1127 family)
MIVAEVDLGNSCQRQAVSFESASARTVVTARRDIYLATAKGNVQRWLVGRHARRQLARMLDRLRDLVGSAPVPDER